MDKFPKIGFGGSCHWCTEAIFQSIVGVVKVEQGWITPKGNRDFSEAVLVHFDPLVISISDLVEIHLHSHSCTENHSMREKYRSAVYVFSSQQGDAVMRAILKAQNDFEKPIITQILPFGEFRLNSAEFLDYYATDPDRPFCKTYIDPKLKALLGRFGNKIAPISLAKK